MAAVTQRVVHAGLSVREKNVSTTGMYPHLQGISVKVTACPCMVNFANAPIGETSSLEASLGSQWKL